MQLSYDKILYLAHRKGESISSLERKSGISNGIIKRWSTTTSPTLENLAKLCNYLGVTLNDIIDGQKNSTATLEQRQLDLYQELYQTYQTFHARNLRNPLQLCLSSVAIGEYLELSENETVMIPVYRQLMDIVEKQETRRQEREYARREI